MGLTPQQSLLSLKGTFYQIFSSDGKYLGLTEETEIKIFKKRHKCYDLIFKKLDLEYDKFLGYEKLLKKAEKNFINVNVKLNNEELSA